MRRIDDYVVVGPSDGIEHRYPAYETAAGHVVFDMPKFEIVEEFDNGQPKPTRTRDAAAKPQRNRIKDAARRIRKLEKVARSMKQHDRETAHGLVEGGEVYMGERGEHVASYNPDDYAFFKDARTGVLHVHKRRKKASGRTGDAAHPVFGVLDSEGTAREQHSRHLDQLSAALAAHWEKQKATQ